MTAPAAETRASSKPVELDYALDVVPFDLGDLVDVEADDEAVHVHIADASIRIDFGGYTAEPAELRGVAELLDHLASEASGAADELRHIANTTCEACNGSGWVQGVARNDDVACVDCAAAGRVA